MKEIQDRLSAVRAEMVTADLDAFLVPRADEYLGEYVPEHNERLRWISGFSGSAGIVIVLSDEAVIFVDGRYTIQVQQQVPGDLFEFRVLTRFAYRKKKPGAVVRYDFQEKTP